jgi:hypothetical protein
MRPACRQVHCGLYAGKSIDAGARSDLFTGFGPSDFYLFGKLKMALMGAAFADNDQLLQGMMKVFNEILREELEAAFEERVLRRDRCIQ